MFAVSHRPLFSSIRLMSLLLAAGTCGSAQAANLLTNASFENPPTTVSQYSSIPGWTRTCGISIEIQSTGGTGLNAADGTQWWESDGVDNTCLTQTVPSAGNTIYQLSFYYSPRPGVAHNAVEVRFNGQVIDTLNFNGSLLNNTAWQQAIYNVVSYSNTATVEFRGVGGPPDSVGGFIDGVVLEELSCGRCPGDANGDGAVTFTDLTLILSNFGPCP